MMRTLLGTSIRRSLLFRGDQTIAQVIDLPSLRPALDDFRSIIARTLAHVEQCLDSDLGALAQVELATLPTTLADLLRKILNETEPTQSEALQEAEGLGVRFDSVPAAAVAQLITSPLGGSHYQQSFADLGTSLERRLRNALTAGLTSGQSVQQVARAVEGVLDNSRFEAERIVRSEYTRVSNQAALLTYQRNRDVIKAVMWVATLDKATCPTCGALDGKQWPPNKARVPGVSTHPKCRCTLVPVLKSAQDLGLTNPTPETRASFDGQVPATQKYPEWFAEQSAAFQREVLGPTRYALYSSGRATIRDFAGLRGARPVGDVLRRISSPAKFEVDDYLSDEELQTERFTRRETPAERAKRIKQKAVDPETAAALRRALGIDEPAGATAFTPAKTVEQANKYTQSLGVKKIDIYGDKPPLAVVNDVNATLTKAKKAGVPMPPQIRYQSGRESLIVRSGAAADYREGTITIYQDAKFWNNPNNHAYVMNKTRWWSTDDRGHAIMHELGHHAHAMANPKKFADAASQKLLDKYAARLTELMPKVSRYAATDPREFVAEVFAGMQNGYKYSGDVLDLYKELGGPIGAVRQRTVVGTGTSALRSTTTLPTSTTRAFSGRTIDTAYRIGGKGRTKELGDFGESVARSWLEQQGASVEKANGFHTNYPIDAVARADGKVLAYEIKAGEVHNQPGSMNWRLKIGLPGQDEQEWLRRASAKQKAAWTQMQYEKIFDRKIAGLQELARKYGKTVKITRVRNAAGATIDVAVKGNIEARTLAMIVNSDTGLVDLYEFDGFHKYIGWKGRETAARYVGTVSYRGRLKPSLIRNTKVRR